MTSLFSLSCAASARAETLECRQLPALIEAFERNHYVVRELDQEIQKRTVEKFIDALDPMRTLLLQDDVAKLRKDLLGIFDAMEEGRCTMLRDAMRLVISRAEEDHKLVKKLTGPDYKLDESVELIFDPEKRGYTKTKEEREALVTKMAHFQVSNLLLAGLDVDAAKKQLAHRYELAVKRLRERDERNALPTIFAETFASALDPHSAYMSAESLQDFQIQMRLSLEGIGAALSSEDGVTVIESLVPGGQAEKSQKLRPKDKIIGVAQEGEKAVSVIDMDLKDVVKMIRGKKGTRVTLTILRETPETKTFDVTITRDKIDVKEQAAKITYETRKAGERTLKIGLIDLPSFYGGGGEEGGRSSYADMKRLLAEANKEKVDGIVLDLSRNGGGLLEDAVKIAGLFIKKGAIVSTKSSNGRAEVLADTDEDVAWSGPLVVLTSPGSASASEILAGALRDYRRALIVGGEQTFGKGTVQVLLPLPGELGAMKVTSGMFFLPGGASTQQRGVPSDVRVPSLLDGIEVGEKSLDYSLPPQSTEPFLGTTANAASGAQRWRPIDPTQVSAIAARSAERVAKDTRLQEIKKELAEREKNKGVVKLADIRKKTKEEKAKEAAAAKESGKDKEKVAAAEKDSRDKFKEMQAAFVAEGANILLDLITATPAGPSSAGVTTPGGR